MPARDTGHLNVAPEPAYPGSQGADRMRHPAHGKPSLDVREPARPGQELEQHRDEHGRYQRGEQDRRQWQHARSSPAPGQRPDECDADDKAREARD